MKTEERDITPKMATEYLLKNHSNRPMRRSLVRKFVRLYQDGSFDLTHQGIAFADDETLLDGQHRMQAIVDSGITVRMMVTEGLDKSAFQNMDCGTQRSLSDRCIFDPDNRERNAKITTICRTLYNTVATKYNKSSRAGVSATNAQVMYDTYQTSITAILDFILLKIPKDVRQSFCSNPHILTTLCLYHHYNPKEALEFSSRLYTGAPTTSSDDPIAMCRAVLSKNKHMTTKSMLELLYWAINWSHSGKAAKKCGRALAPWFLKSEAASL